jgi:hypothetical protein
MLALSYKNSKVSYPITLYYHDKDSSVVRKLVRYLECMDIPVKVEVEPDMHNPYSRKGRDRKFNRGHVSSKTSSAT